MTIISYLHWLKAYHRLTTEYSHQRLGVDCSSGFVTNKIFFIKQQQGEEGEDDEEQQVGTTMFRDNK